VAPVEILDCPWRFGDTLTFAAHLGDILGAGLRLQLSARSDVYLGPLQVQLARAQELGEAVLDLRRQLLPACEPAASRGLGGDFGGSGRPEWRTPALLVPLTRVGESDHGGVQVTVVGRVVLSVSVNTNPEALLRRAEESERPLVDKVVDPVVRCIQAPGSCMEEPADWLPLCGGCGSAHECRSSAPLEAAPRGKGLEDEAVPDVASPAAFRSYTTCEVPPSLAAEEPDWTQPALGGLWPPPSSHRRGCHVSPRRAHDRAPEVACELAPDSSDTRVTPTAIPADAGMERLWTAGIRHGCDEHDGVRASGVPACGPTGFVGLGRQQLLLTPAGLCSRQQGLASVPRCGDPWNTPHCMQPQLESQGCAPAPPVGWGQGAAVQCAMQYA